MWTMDTREYIGDTVLGKTRSKSYKEKKTIDLPPEEWKIIEGTHEPILDNPRKPQHNKDKSIHSNLS